MNFGQENPRDKGKIMDVKKQIIALGGGGIGTDKLNMALDKYKLQASGKTKPKIAYQRVKNRAKVKGINMVKKHVKTTKEKKVE